MSVTPQISSQRVQLMSGNTHKKESEPYDAQKKFAPPKTEHNAIFWFSKQNPAVEYSDRHLAISALKGLQNVLKIIF